MRRRTCRKSGAVKERSANCSAKHPGDLGDTGPPDPDDVVSDAMERRPRGNIHGVRAPSKARTRPRRFQRGLRVVGRASSLLCAAGHRLNAWPRPPHGKKTDNPRVPVPPDYLRYEEHPVVVPQVMHPTCRFQDVSSVPIGAILQGLLSAHHAMCEPLDNGTRTEHGHSESPAPPKFRDLLVGPTGFEPVFQSRPRFRLTLQAVAERVEVKRTTRLKHAARISPTGCGE